MATGGDRRRPQKYPVELRERAVRMVLEVRKDTGQSFGVITRVAKELGIGSESLRKWVHQAEIDGGASPGTSTVDARRLSELELTTGSCAGRTRSCGKRLLLCGTRGYADSGGVEPLPGRSRGWGRVWLSA